MMSKWLNDNQITKVDLKSRSVHVRVIIIVIICLLGICDVTAASQMQVLTKRDHQTLTAGYKVTKAESQDVNKFRTLLLVDKKTKMQYAVISAMRPAKVEKHKNPNYDPKAEMPDTKQPTKKFLKKLQKYQQVRDKYDQSLKFTGGPSLRMAMISSKDGKSTADRLPITTTLTQAPFATLSRLARRHFYYNIRMTSEIHKVVNDHQTVKSQRIDGFDQQTWKLDQSAGQHTVSVTYGYPNKVVQAFKQAKSKAIQLTIFIWLAIAVIFWILSGILVTGAQASKSLEQGE